MLVAVAVRTLLIMRHADAEPARPGLADVDRQLTAAGHARARSQAPIAAAHEPDVVLCSAATRATQTLAHLDCGDAVVHVEGALYEATATTLLGRLAELDPDVTTAWVLGHLPTVALLTVGLVGAPGVEDFMPGTIALVDLGVGWADLRPGSGTLRHLAR